METHRKGDLTEAVLIAELMKRSIPVSVPFGDNERYDIVTETPGGGLLKLQVKTGWMADGTIEFHGTSQHTNARETSTRSTPAMLISSSSTATNWRACTSFGKTSFRPEYRCGSRNPNK